MSNGNPESQEKSCGDEHVEIDGSRLEYNTKKHDDTSNDDAPATSKAVSDIRNEGDRDDRADSHDTAEQAQKCALRMVEVIFPRRKGLQTVDDGSIVAIRRRGDDDEHQTDVCLSQSWILVPGHLGELASRKAECTLSWGVHRDRVTYMKQLGK